MKSRRTALAAITATLAAVAALPATAQSKVEIYGIADAGIEFSNNGKGTLTRVVSAGLQGARLGFRGTEDLGGGLNALFKLEQGINYDTGTLGQGGLAFGREATVGLSSRDLGILTAGRVPMPYYQLAVHVDAFVFGQAGSLVAMTRSTPTGNRQLLPLLATARTDNTVQYVTPLIAGVQGRINVGLGEGSATIGRTLAASLQYVKGPVNVLASFERFNGANNRNGHMQGMMIGGNYDIGGPKIFAGFTRETNSCTTCTGVLLRPEGVLPSGQGEFRMINLGLRYPVGPLIAIAQVTRVQDRTDYLLATGKRDSTWLAAGGEYYFSKRTILWGSVGTADNRSGSSYVIGSGGAQQAANATGAGNPRARTFNAGITHLF